MQRVSIFHLDFLTSSASRASSTNHCTFQALTRLLLFLLLLLLLVAVAVAVALSVAGCRCATFDFLTSSPALLSLCGFVVVFFFGAFALAL